jgi:hypothetical protein
MCNFMQTVTQSEIEELSAAFQEMSAILPSKDDEKGAVKISTWLWHVYRLQRQIGSVHQPLFGKDVQCLDYAIWRRW